ncbi:DUF5983 family protein [Burkholderia vietnamiensis]|uniref:DUF5983 family protein n=1 Tax=Burkholderia vietnamiensis TaxID=60552 RepID=UPI001D133ABD|nr:hypothetical protein [Burkholderia vietnamiensis]UEC01676.1 hypothetical protein LK462_06520 [Burkholderia vietnamiensis]
MNHQAEPSLGRHMEPLVAISIVHLSPCTRQRLADGALSVIAYPNDYGGFVYVDPQGEHTPQEPELAALLTLARRAGVIWIKFDADADVVDGVAVFDNIGEAP